MLCIALARNQVSLAVDIAGDSCVVTIRHGGDVLPFAHDRRNHTTRAALNYALVDVVIFAVDDRPVVDRRLSDTPGTVTHDSGHTGLVAADGIRRGNGAARDGVGVRLVPELMSEVTVIFRVQFRIVRNGHR